MMKSVNDFKMFYSCSFVSCMFGLEFFEEKILFLFEIKLDFINLFKSCFWWLFSSSFISDIIYLSFKVSVFKFYEFSGILSKKLN